MLLRFLRSPHYSARVKDAGPRHIPPFSLHHYLSAYTTFMPLFSRASHTLLSPHKARRYRHEDGTFRGARHDVPSTILRYAVRAPRHRDKMLKTF